MIDQGIQLLSALARFSREEDDWRVTQEFEFLLNHLLVIEEQLVLVHRPLLYAAGRRALRLAAGALLRNVFGTLRGFDGEVPFVHDDDYRAARFFGVACNRGIARGHAVLAVDYQQRLIRALQAAARHHYA